MNYQEAIKNAAEYMWDNPNEHEARLTIFDLSTALSISFNMKRETVAENIIDAQLEYKKSLAEEEPKLKSFTVCWSKRYVAVGEFDIQAPDEDAAYRIADEMIGDQTGSMQYEPDENVIEVYEND
jgi:hypothetical protein